MWRLGGCSTEDTPEEKPKPSEKAGSLNSVRRSVLLYITGSDVLLNARGAWSYLQNVTGFLLRH